ncbi:MAG: DNA polymerase IV [Deltaproteobacteria bacterium]|nr:DNA polymerase IV [Deltaproteobacteria bacterium]MBZ0219437.1 DNA polymerase IV [Deltaproteobacteria bacterium]
MGRAIIHLDLDAFFASVEIKRNPELRGRPVVVGADGDPSKRGVVSAASYEARKDGVKAGMPLRQALRRSPSAVFLPVDFEAYERESERFMAILRDYSPLVESFGLDEAFIELAPAPGEDPFPLAIRLAREMKGRIRRELGLTVSVGVAPNKLMAKMASEAGKPDGFFVIEEAGIGKFLRDLPVRRLFGVGPATEKRLKDLGIETVGELARAPVRHLERNFGPERGKTLNEHARGLDESPVVPFHEPSSLSREVTFEEDASDLHIIKETLYELTQDLVRRLKDGRHKARSVGIKVRFNNFRTITRSETLETASDSQNDIRAAALRLIDSVDIERPVRLVGVKISRLEG